MARLIIFFIIGCAFSANALDIEEIRAALKLGKSSDTLEVKSRTTVTMQGKTQTIDNHMVQLGSEKVWIEIRSTAYSQRIIRNGARMQMTDLKTNQTKVLSFAENQSAILPSAPQVLDPLGVYNWSSPEKQSNGLYMLHSSERDIWYDATKGRVSRILDRNPSMPGVTTISQIEYCDACTAKNTPQSMVTTIQMNGGESSEMHVEFLIWKTSTGLPSRLFDF